MRRKGFALAIALALLLAPAAAEEAAKLPADLFDLYAYEEDGSYWLGTAAPIADGILVTAAVTGVQTGSAISDGYGLWDAAVACTDENGLLTVVFYDEAEHVPKLGSYQLPPYGEGFSGSSLYVRCGDEQGSRINRSVKKASVIRWKDLDCLQLFLSGPAELGAAVLTDAGELAGILTAKYAEGENRYIALPAENIYRAVAEAADRIQSMDLTARGPEGFSVTAEGNLVTFDWSGMEMTPPEEGMTRYLVVADAGNSYLTYFPLESEGATAVRMLLTPGRTYVSGFTAGTSVPDSLPEEYAVTVLPEAKPLTDYGFRSTACMLAEGPEGGLKKGEKPVPVTDVTEELLRSGRAYFYSSSVYDVEEQIDGLTLLVTLTTPAGENYRYVSGWIYDPAYEKEDTWFVSMDDTELLENLNRDGYPAGVYELSFYVDGKLADTFFFELP